MQLKSSFCNKKSPPLTEGIVFIQITEFIRLIQQIIESPGFSIYYHQVYR